MHACMHAVQTQALLLQPPLLPPTRAHLYSCRRFSRSTMAAADASAGSLLNCMVSISPSVRVRKSSGLQHTTRLLQQAASGCGCVLAPVRWGAVAAMLCTACAQAACARGLRGSGQAPEAALCQRSSSITHLCTLSAIFSTLLACSRASTTMNSAACRAGSRAPRGPQHSQHAHTGVRRACAAGREPCHRRCCEPGACRLSAGRGRQGRSRAPTLHFRWQ
jgi:hypothetical protein